MKERVQKLKFCYQPLNDLWMRKTILLLVLLIVFDLSACGFRLRGTVELPPEVKQLAIEDSATGSQLLPVIKLQLRRNGIKPLEELEQARMILVIHSDAYKRRVLTVSSVGQVQEFELSYNVDYSIKNVADPEASLMRQQLSIKRDLRFSVDEVLGKATEEARLKEDMVRAASERILRRLPKAVKK